MFGITDFTDNNYRLGKVVKIIRNTRNRARCKGIACVPIVDTSAWYTSLEVDGEHLPVFFAVFQSINR